MSCAQAWAWGEVPSLLGGAIAPDLPLHDGVTPMEHAALLASLVPPDGDVVVAGHSYGAVVALPAAEMLGERVRAVVAFDGIVCDDGESAHSARPARAAGRRAEAQRRGDGMWTAGAQGPGDPDWFGRLQPMPLSAMEAPVALSGAVDRLPRTFVACSRGGMDEQAERARARGWRVVEVDAPHALPLVDPASCAEILRDAVPG